ncbi:hypothetical protein D3C78_1780720 [compost metagenome]
MRRALHHQNRGARGFHAGEPEHLLVGHLHLVRRDDDAYAADAQAGAGAQIHVKAAIEGAVRIEASL